MSTLDQVNAVLSTTKDARAYKRAMAVKLLLLEFEPRDIAELLQVTESFVSTWKKLCFEHGVFLQDLPETPLDVGARQGLNRRYPSRSSVSRWNRCATFRSP
jgi:hypothetical protein